MIKSLLVKSTLVAAIAAGILPVAASAGEVQNRLNDQQARINQGVADGQLTHREYDRTESRDSRIEAQRNWDLKHDGGTLTHGQYVRLNRELNGDSRNIYFDKHNFARQPGAPKI